MPTAKAPGSAKFCARKLTSTNTRSTDGWLGGKRAPAPAPPRAVQQSDQPHGPGVTAIMMREALQTHVSRRSPCACGAGNWNELDLSTSNWKGDHQAQEPTCLGHQQQKHVRVCVSACDH